MWPQRVDALRVSRSFVVSSICIYTVRFSVIIKEGLRKCETLKNKTRPCGMKMIILGGGCFEPSLIRLQHGLNESTLQTLKNKYFKRNLSTILKCHKLGQSLMKTWQIYVCRPKGLDLNNSLKRAASYFHILLFLTCAMKLLLFLSD